MKLGDLYFIIRGKWPQSMPLDGAEVLSGGGLRCWELDEIGERVMESCDPEGIEYIAAWSFHQAIAEVARNSLERGVGRVQSEEVGLPLFARQLRFNLEDPSWNEVLAEFEAENPDF